MGPMTNGLLAEFGHDTQFSFVDKIITIELNYKQKRDSISTYAVEINDARNW